MASVDCLLEKGVMSTTAPGLILSTSPPGRKNAGAAAGALGYGQEGAVASRAAESRNPGGKSLRRGPAKANAPPARKPPPRKRVAVRRAGRARPPHGRCAPTNWKASGYAATTAKARSAAPAALST